MCNTYVTFGMWLIYVCDMTHFVFDTWHDPTYRVVTTRYVTTRYGTHLCVWHDSFYIYTRLMCVIYMWLMVCDSSMCVIWLILYLICATTPHIESSRLGLWLIVCDSFMCVTWLILYLICATTPHIESSRLGLWLIVCDSFMFVTWLILYYTWHDPPISYLQHILISRRKGVSRLRNARGIC